MISSRFALSANLMVGSDDRRVVRGLGGYERTLLVTEGHQRKWEDKKRERRYETTRQMTCSAARLGDISAQQTLSSFFSELG